jgi:DNA-binding NarL/FixJ family response regulator
MMRLFIADDSDMIRSNLTKKLSEIDGIEVVGEAQDSSDAVEAVERLKPDVAILDIRMPKGDGILALRTIKKNKYPPKVIMYTNYPYPQYRKMCLAAGADYFFDKSTEYRELTGVLNQLKQEISATPDSKELGRNKSCV